MLANKSVSSKPLSWLDIVEGRGPHDFVDLTGIPGLLIDLRYASANNFTGKNLYGEHKRAFLHKQAFTKLAIAQAYLQKNLPGHNLLILDALRPRSVQRILFSYVEGTDEESYVANPDKGSVHNFGFAVDLTIVDSQGHEIDMGTIFDDFADLAQPRYEDKFLQSGDLKPQQLENRRLLRAAMTAGGFQGIPNEWWHFNALPIQEIKTNFPIVE